MDSLRYAGWTHTDSLDPEEAVTDSAAAATAFATGVRTYNGASVDLDGNPVGTLLEHARSLRKSTGVVTTAQVTDATLRRVRRARPTAATRPGDRALPSRSRGLDASSAAARTGGTPQATRAPTWDDPADPRPEVSRSDQGNLVERAQGHRVRVRHDRRGPVRRHPRPAHPRRFANEEMFEQFLKARATSTRPSPVDHDPQGAWTPVALTGRASSSWSRRRRSTSRTPLPTPRSRSLPGRRSDETVALVHAFAKRHPGILVVVVGDHETGGLAIENVDADDESGDPASTSAEVLQSSEDGPFPVAGTDLEFTIDWTTSGHMGGVSRR